MTLCSTLSFLVPRRSFTYFEHYLKNFPFKCGRLKNMATIFCYSFHQEAELLPKHPSPICADSHWQNAVTCDIRELCSFCIYPLKRLPPIRKETSVHTRGEHSKRQSPASQDKPQNKTYFAGTLILDFVAFLTVRNPGWLFKPPSLWFVMAAHLLRQPVTVNDLHVTYYKTEMKS